MPLPIVAASAAISTASKVIGGIGKGIKAVGGFVGKLFGGGRRRRKRREAARAARKAVKAEQQIESQQQKLSSLQTKQQGYQNTLASVFGGIPSVTPADSPVGGYSSDVFQQSTGLPVIDVSDYESDPARFSFMDRVDRQKRKSMMTYIFIGVGAFFFFILLVLLLRKRR